MRSPFRKNFLSLLFLILLFVSAVFAALPATSTSHQSRRSGTTYNSSASSPLGQSNDNGQSQANPTINHHQNILDALSTSVPSSPSLMPNPPTWTSIGPEPIATNSTFTWGAPPFSGRVTSIVVNGSNTQEIFVGSAQGGVWKSTDGGAHWTLLMDSQSNLAVGAIVLSPDNKTIYVGTGEPNQCGDCYVGVGLLKSTDGGSAWTLLGSSVFSGSAISSILVDSSNPNVLLVSTTSAVCCVGLQFTSNPAGLGVFQSTDGGSTWNLVLSPSSGKGVADLVADPNNSSVVYAGDFSGYVWESTNWGASGSWNPLLYESSSANQGRVTVSVSEALPNILFAAFANATGSSTGLLGIYEYNLTSGVITTLGMPPNVIDHFGGSDPACGYGTTEMQCWYNLVLSISPTNASDMYFGGASLYRSTDGGTSWTAIGGYPADSAIHPDMHALVFMPGNNSTIFVGDDGGISESTNQGTTWTDLNDNLSITQFYHLAVSNSGKLILAGAQDNGCNEYNGSLAWNQVATGDGGWVGFDPANNQIMYCVQDGHPAISTDGGKTFQQEVSGMTQYGSLDAPMGQNLNNPGTLYFGAGNIIYKTTNNMQSWVLSYSDPYGNIISIEVSPSNSSIIYAGDSVDNVLVSTNAGSTWNILGTLSDPIVSVAVNPANANNVYVAEASFEFPVVTEFLNGTQTTVPATGLPSSSVNVIKIFQGKMFAGLDSGGVYYLMLGGSSWSQVGAGIPNSAVFDIAASNGTLYAATHGRGVWAINTPLLGIAGLTVSYQVLDGGTGFTAPTLTYVYDGVSNTTTLGTSPTTILVDYGSNWSVNGELSGSSSTQRWQTNQVTSGTATSNATLAFSYYLQFRLTTSYSVQDGGSPTAPMISSTQFGSSFSQALTTSASSIWLDNGASWSITNPLSSSTSSERWIAASSTSGTVSGSSTVSPVYYNQMASTLSYSVSDGGSPSAPTASGLQYGAQYSPTLSNTPTVYWFDANGQISFSNPLSSSSSERWFTASPSLTATSSQSLDVNYNHQFLVIWTVTPSGAGTISSSQSQWYEAITPVQIAADPNAGFAFAGWSSSTVSITFSNNALASTTMTVSGAGNIEASFNAVVTTTSSSGSSSTSPNATHTTSTLSSSIVQSSSSSTSSSKSGGGGIPEFSFQGLLMLLLTFGIIASYLAVRVRSKASKL